MTAFFNSLASLLKNRGLILRAGTAAVRPSVPPYLIFFVTHRCNAACPFCFDRGRRGQDELSLAEIEQMAQGFRGVVQATLTGGEPFLREDIGEAAMAFARAGARSMTIATNATLPERAEAVVRTLLANFPGLYLDLDISLDGPAEVHDRLRGVAGAHASALELAGRLAPLHESIPRFRTGATVCVSAFNQEWAEDTVRSLLDAGLFQRVQAVLVRGRPHDPHALDYDLSTYRRCSDLLTGGPSSGSGARIRETLSCMVREAVAAAAEGEAGRPCLAGRTMVMVDASGGVYPCEMLGQLFPEGKTPAGIESWRLGSLRESGYDIRKIMRSDNAMRVRSWIRENRCTCGFECAAYNNLVFNPARWPEIAKRLVRPGP